MICGSLWSLFIALGIIFSNGFLDKICIVWGLFSQYFFVLFCLSFSKMDKTNPFFSILITLIPIIISPIILFSDLIIGKTIFHPGGFVESPDGPFVFIFYIFHFIYSFMAFYYLVKGYKLASGIRRIQFQYLFIGFGLVIFWFLFLSILLPSFGIYYFISLSSYSLIILAIIFLYIISRFRFMGIRFVIRKGMIYTISAVIVFAIYTALVFIIRGFFTELTKTNTYILNALAIIIIALGFEPLRREVRKVIDYWFFPERKKLEKALQEIKSELPRTVDLGKFAQTANEEIGKIIPVQKIQFFLLDKKEGIYHLIFPDSEKDKIKFRLDHILIKYILNKKEIIVREELAIMSEGKSQVEKEEIDKIDEEMEKYDFAVAIPLGYERPNGILFLEAKPNRDAYTSDDLNFLDDLKNQASFALDNAIMYKEAVERIRVE
jgi:hypothetical protein